ncbi:hypothetical protein ACTCUN_14090 [Stutzerimonas balearica]|uniref:hypothetical protein n=1 Tax=Stutzerimonas balearica TaxID=74829 RepID=UPI003F75F186
MNRVVLTFALTALVALPAAAQWPAGTPRDDQGSRPSPMGNPTPQQEVETHRDDQGRVVTEDGKPVRSGAGADAEASERSTRHDGKGGPHDESTSSGSVE